MKIIEANAHLIYTQTYDLKGNPEQVTCEWQGPKDGILAISGAFINEKNGMKILPPSGKITERYRAIRKISQPDIGDIVEAGPYRLKVFEYDALFFVDTYYLTRLDSPIANLRVTAYRLTRWLELIYRRLIITAAVWKLAGYHGAQIPSWRDLHIAKRFKSEG